MRRFLRRVLKVAAGVSLLLCAGFVALAVRGWFASDRVGWAGWRDEGAGVWQGWGVRSERGSLLAYHFVAGWRFDDPSSVSGGLNETMRPHFFWYRGRAGAVGGAAFRGETIRFGGGLVKGGEIAVVAAPPWVLAGVFAVAPGAVGVRAVRRRLAARRVRRGGLCGACGYDLRATPERCPECGRVAVAGGVA